MNTKLYELLKECIKKDSIRDQTIYLNEVTELIHTCLTTDKRMKIENDIAYSAILLIASGKTIYNNKICVEKADKISQNCKFAVNTGTGKQRKEMFYMQAIENLTQMAEEEENYFPGSRLKLFNLLASIVC